MDMQAASAAVDVAVDALVDSSASVDVAAV